MGISLELHNFWVTGAVGASAGRVHALPDPVAYTDVTVAIVRRIAQRRRRFA